MMKSRIVFLLIFFAITFSACKKKGDEVRPEIEFSFPSTYSTYHVFDTVFVTVNVSDDKKLEKLSIDIIDHNNRRIVAEFLKVDFQNLQAEVSAGLELNDIHLLSGSYNIRALVSDGENERIIFREINIIEEPLKRERLFLLRESGGDTYVDSLSADGVVFPGIQFSSDYNGAAINSYHQEMMILGGSDAQIQIASGPELTNISTLDFMGGNTDNFFNDIFFDPIEKRYYVSFNDGRILEYDQNGILRSSIITTSGRRPFKLYVDENYIYAEERSYDNQNTLLVVYYKISGALYQSSTIDFDVVGMHKIADELIIIANEGNNGLVARYYLQTNGLSIEDEEFDLINTSLYDDFYSTDESILIATDSQVIFLNIETQYLWSGVGWSTGASDLIIDSVSGTIMALNGNEIIILSPGGIMNTVGLGQDFQKVLILYNK